jgi:polysaccharide deacetylase family protein (PEP-CTERM system associated)
LNARIRRSAGPGPTGDAPCPGAAAVILSFDVEAADRIEAAAALAVDPGLRDRLAARVAPATRRLLDALGERGVKATFFVLGDLAARDPALVRAIQDAGHEVASHGWDHRRVLAMTPAAFRDDLRRSRDALEQAAGAAVVGYRAPTFSIVARTAWALDVLAEEGFLYDSSIYPVRHDRYGVPHAPRGPFLARGEAGGEVLEIPPATLRVLGGNVPAGGGGYFRLFPPAVIEHALRQTRRSCRPAVAMLYFHPWEFDPDQPRLPLGRLSRWRTYVGIARSRQRLDALLARHRGSFARAVDVARRLDADRAALPAFRPSRPVPSRPPG